MPCWGSITWLLNTYIKFDRFFQQLFHLQVQSTLSFCHGSSTIASSFFPLEKCSAVKSHYHTAYRHLRNTKNEFNCENIKMICNFVVLSMFEIFIFNPNQKREKINKNRKKNMQNLHNLTKFMSFLFLAYNFFCFFFKFQRGLGGLFLLFMSIFLSSLFFTSYMVKRR